MSDENRSTIKVSDMHHIYPNWTRKDYLQFEDGYLHSLEKRHLPVDPILDIIFKDKGDEDAKRRHKKQRDSRRKVRVARAKRARLKRTNIKTYWTKRNRAVQQTTFSNHPTLDEIKQKTKQITKEV